MRVRLPGPQQNSRPRQLPWLVLSLLAVSIIAAGMLLTVGCDNVFGDCDDASTETHDDSFTVGDSARVVVKSANGGITVTAGPGNQVRVEATLRAPEKLAYSVTQDGDTITVEAKPKTGRAWGDCMEANIVVTAPTMTDVDIHTSNGALTVEGINGSGDLETSNGAITLFNVKGDFKGGTSNAAMDIRNAVGEVDLQTTNGSVSFEGELIAGGDNRLVTSNGRVDVKLIGEPSISLDVSTTNAKINATLPMTTSLVEKNHIVGTIGNGEAALYVRTSNSDVTIR